ncbi:3625_t:CDS:1, partial [Ambispora leptoticha]
KNTIPTVNKRKSRKYEIVLRSFRISTIWGFQIMRDAAPSGFLLSGS